MRDFTLNIYKQLLERIGHYGYEVLPFVELLTRNDQVNSAFYILRHDVDRKPLNSLRIAEIEASMGLRGTYYFRILPESFQPKYIESIRDLGHEIGYHYEDLTITKGNKEEAISHFGSALERLRVYAEVKTICMHGSPSTKWDNKDLWKSYDYRDFGIIGEPYFDIDFNSVHYLTDTGRMWDGFKYSLRDHVGTNSTFSVHSTKELIESIQTGVAPKRIMQNIHPERWTDDTLEWSLEWIKSSIKNPVKKLLKQVRS